MLFAGGLCLSAAYDIVNLNPDSLRTLSIIFIIGVNERGLKRILNVYRSYGFVGKHICLRLQAVSRWIGSIASILATPSAYKQAQESTYIGR
jgi:hypothetical protein